MKTHANAKNEADRWPSTGIWEQSLLIKGRWRWNKQNLSGFYLVTQLFGKTERSKKRGPETEWDSDQRTNGQEASEVESRKAGATLSPGTGALRKDRNYKDSSHSRIWIFSLSHRARQWRWEKGMAPQNRSEVNAGQGRGWVRGPRLEVRPGILPATYVRSKTGSPAVSPAPRPTAKHSLWTSNT